MGIFTVRGRHAAAGPEARVALTTGEGMGLPHRLEAVQDALVSGSSSLAACEVVGQDLARDGASVDEALATLRQTWQSVRGCDPPYDAVTAFMVAWSETTLGYLHQLSCEDPLTGLASHAHLRSRLSELYRAHVRPNDSHALVVCELPEDDADPTDETGDHFTRAMRVTRLGECARTVFVRGETVGRLGVTRVGIIVERDDRLGRRVRVLRTLLAGIDSERRTSRVWIEGLPGSDDTAAMLLDELARP